MSFIQKTALCLTGVILLISGCASTDGSSSAGSAADEKQIESSLKQVWEGELAEKLVGTFGKPDMIIDATILGGPVSEGYVYSNDKLSENNECINVFVVETFHKTIYDYFCR